MQDYHIHSRYSTDAVQTLDTICKTAVQKGLSEVAITDHIDIDYPYGLEFSFDREERHVELLRVKAGYPALAVKNGVEIGLMPETKKDYANIINNHPFDFVIASIHVVDGQDPYYPDYFEGKTKAKAYRRYLEAIYDGMKGFDDYDVLGHIGYVSRFFAGKDKQIRFNDFPDVLDSILKQLVDLGKGLEINTKGIGSTGDTLPSKSILKRYLELGGEVITIGSDAHVPERIGEHILETADYLKQMGFKHYASFTGRNISMNRL